MGAMMPDAPVSRACLMFSTVDWLMRTIGAGPPAPAIAATIREESGHQWGRVRHRPPASRAAVGRADERWRGRNPQPGAPGGLAGSEKFFKAIGFHNWIQVLCPGL